MMLPIFLMAAVLDATPLPLPVPLPVQSEVPCVAQVWPWCASPPVRASKKRRARPVKRTTSSRGAWSLIALAARHAMLRDFLVEAGSETPAFVDRHVVAVAGVHVGPTSVDVDFLGSPLVRATVVNPSSRAVDVLLRIDVADAVGRTSHASTWVHLRPADSRAVEVFCPGVVAPVSARWSGLSLGQP